LAGVAANNLAAHGAQESVMQEAITTIENSIHSVTKCE
jgi:hypothetical protein